jgi:hypothetical protein
MSRDILKMSMTPASGGGDIHQKALDVQCFGIGTLSWGCVLEAWTAVIWHVLRTHWEVSGCRVQVTNLACVFEILLKERVEFDINAQLGPIIGIDQL